jgi:hypothetical protein
VVPQITRSHEDASRVRSVPREGVAVRKTARAGGYSKVTRWLRYVDMCGQAVYRYEPDHAEDVKGNGRLVMIPNGVKVLCAFQSE